MTEAAKAETGKKDLTKSEARKQSRKEARKKLATKIRDDKDFAKKYFEEKSKRAIDKKVAFRRRHQLKK